MAGVNFYLKKPIEGKSLIIIRLLYGGISFTYSTGERIEPNKWDKKKQEPKMKSLLASNEQSLKEYLANLKKETESFFLREQINGLPTPSMLRDHLDGIKNKLLVEDKKRREEERLRSSFHQLIDRFISGEILSRGKQKAKSTLNNYKAVKKHLVDFEAATGYQVDFDTINLDFFNRYTAWLGKRIAVNTLAKDIRQIKVVMQEGVDMDFTENMKFKHKKFSVTGTETDAVALNEKEIMKVYRTEIANKKLDKVRDLFVFGCFTGLRFSDYSRVERKNIVDVDGQLMIKITTQKTAEDVIVPTNPVILEILKKYESSLTGLPKALSNQKFNDYVKDLCKLSGLTDKGRLSSNLNKELWECISSHTARRSFCTNTFLSGFPVHDLMKISGHRTEKAFNKYIKVSKESAAKRLAEHQKKNWPRLMLMVA